MKKSRPRIERNAQGATRKRKQEPKQGFRSWLFSWKTMSRLFSFGLTMAMLLLIVMVYFARDLPDISGLGAARKAPGIQVLSAGGDVVASYGEIYGEYLHFKDIPVHLVGAVLATEDRRFFHHFGIDPLGIARAMVANVMAGRWVQGGSTITQQLAKNVFLTPDRTLTRKLQEMLLAFWLEARFSKEEILSIYLNRVYLGAGNYGVDAASRHYFNKPAKELTLAESALIAGLLKAPSRYAPTSDIELAKKRTLQVLLNMADAGRISEAEAKKALEGLTFPENVTAGKGGGIRYFADWVVDQLPEYIGRVEEDLVIETTLEPSMQKFAEDAIAAQMTEEVMTGKKVSQAAIVAMRPNGAVTAMIGGKDYGESQYNRAVQARRQPGSAFKMFVYLAAMEMGYRPEHTIEDKPVSIPLWRGSWEPKNYDGKYRGLMTLKDALRQSINTVAAQLIEIVGVDRVITTARRLGVRSELTETPSLALGASEVSLLEMTTAYAHLASDGQGVRPYAIRNIKSKRDDDILFERDEPMNYIVIPPNYVHMMNDMLSSVIAAGTGRGAAIGRPAAGKTGTTSDYKDAWFMGYTPDLVAGVWVGNDNATPTAKVTGGSIPARIWQDFMRSSLEGTAAHGLPTSYDNMIYDALPWRGEDGQPDYQSSPRGPQRQFRPQQTEPRRGSGGDINLSPTFWDKLFDSDKIEYDYPSN